MNDLPHRLEVRCNPANPVLYLACCGLFDLLARMDPEARGHWRNTAPTAFLLDTSVSEAHLLATLLDTFCSPGSWQYDKPAGGKEPTAIRTAFRPANGPAFTVALDWWFETAKLGGEVNAKSAWKMYAGQQTVTGITEDMVTQAATLRKLGKLPATLTELLACEVAMSGRFGLDPRSSRNALDVGYSSNDLGLPVSTAPFSETLAARPASVTCSGRTHCRLRWRGPRRRGGSPAPVTSCSFPSAPSARTILTSPSPKPCPPVLPEP